MEPAPRPAMTGDEYDEEYQDYDDEPDSRANLSTLVVVLAAVLCVTLAGAWWLRESSSERGIVGYAGHTGVLRSPLNGEPEGVGTSGGAQPQAVATAATDKESAAVIREIETITGAIDGHELVGRKVNLTVPVQENANDNAFWVGPRGNRLLVVLFRDRRDATERQESAVVPNGIAPIHAGENATITGSVQRVPTAEDMYSWGLTAKDKAELSARPIYIRADTVMATAAAGE